MLEIYRAEAASGQDGPGCCRGDRPARGPDTPLGLRSAGRRRRFPSWAPGPGRSTLAPDRGRFGQVLTDRVCRRLSSAPPPALSEAARSPPASGIPLWSPFLCVGWPRDGDRLRRRCVTATSPARPSSAAHPVLVDRFLGRDRTRRRRPGGGTGCTSVADGAHQEAGIHSDDAAALPPVTLGRGDIESVRRATRRIAHGAQRACSCSSRPVRPQALTILGRRIAMVQSPIRFSFQPLAICREGLPVWLRRMPGIARGRLPGAGDCPSITVRHSVGSDGTPRFEMKSTG